MTNHDQFLADLLFTADRLHSNTANADRPPTHTWTDVLAGVTEAGNPPKEVTEMSALHMPLTTVSTPATSASRRSVSRVVNLAASLLVIAALAFGGWFAAMQWNEPEPAPRFAAVATPHHSATPQQSEAMCDVEPLSIDRVMEIVENPAHFTAHGPTQSRADRPMIGSPPDADLWEMDAPLELQGSSTVPDEEQFQAVESVANRYVACMVFGTQGQVWSFYNPVSLQSTILAEFPVYASREEVRARVEERINEPAFTGEGAWNVLPFIEDIAEATVNPDRELAIQRESASSYFDAVVMIGVSFVDADGNQIALTNGTGRDQIPNDPTVTGRNSTELYVTMVRIRGSETWLVFPWPSDAELGW